MIRVASGPVFMYLNFRKNFFWWPARKNPKKILKEKKIISFHLLVLYELKAGL